MDKLRVTKDVGEYGFDVKTTTYSFSNLWNRKVKGSFNYIEVNDDGQLYIDNGKYVDIHLPSRQGSVGKVIGIKGTTKVDNQHVGTHYKYAKILVKFEDVDKVVSFEPEQISSSDKTESNYVFVAKAKPKNSHIENIFGQYVEIGDYVIGSKKKSLVIGEIIRVTPKTVRVKPFKLKGNVWSEVNLCANEVFKLEKDLSVEEQIALLALF